MSRKADFSSYEWAYLKEAASLVGFGMIAVSKSGPIGKLREFATLSSCLTPNGIPGQFKHNELVVAVLDDIAGRSSGQRPYIFGSWANTGLSGLLVGLAIAQRSMLLQCERVTMLLAAKSPQAEADGVKRWLLWVARAVAEASGDRWLGMGRKVSDEEFTMLNQIADALHIPPVEAAPTPAELEVMLGLKPPRGDDGATGVGAEPGPHRGSGE